MGCVLSQTGQIKSIRNRSWSNMLKFVQSLILFKLDQYCYIIVFVLVSSISVIKKWTNTCLRVNPYWRWSVLNFCVFLSYLVIKNFQIITFYADFKALNVDSILNCDNNQILCTLKDSEAYLHLPIMVSYATIYHFTYFNYLLFFSFFTNLAIRFHDFFTFTELKVW